MITKLRHFVCCSKPKVIPVPEASLQYQIEQYLHEYNTFISEIVTGTIRILTPKNFDKYDTNKAIVKGLLNEVYVKYGEDTVKIYTTKFDTLDSTLHKVIRRQFRTERLRIHSDLMIRPYIRDIFHTSSSKSFSADF